VCVVCVVCGVYDVCVYLCGVCVCTCSMFRHDRAIYMWPDYELLITQLR
jgi:hypothetical protein